MKRVKEEAPASAPAPDFADSYENVKDVLAALKAKGIRCAQVTLYRDIRAGKLKRHETGRFLKADVETYMAMQLRKHAPGASGSISDDIAELQKEKLQAEVDKLRGAVRKQDLEYDVATGRLCQSESFYRALAERVAILRSRLRAAFQVNALDYQRMSLDDMVDAYFRDLDVALNEFSRPPEYDAEGVPDVFDEDARRKLLEKAGKKAGKGKADEGKGKN